MEGGKRIEELILKIDEVKGIGIEEDKGLKMKEGL